MNGSSRNHFLSHTCIYAHTYVQMRLDRTKLKRTGVAQVRLVVTMQLQEEDDVNDDATDGAMGEDEGRVITFGIVVDVSQLATLL